ncbi:hypothetical protein L2E82_29437 [Cichorium intybus]|uniref:Uncharacterized protein n=1 Tax=Cichorium intybus TaxID=13427 RepID=A0ACB9CY08_CICIN|nr:hypothetical protein L2E82_29437 [Cichorium intybus]
MAGLMKKNLIGIVLGVSIVMRISRSSIMSMILAKVQIILQLEVAVLLQRCKWRFCCSAGSPNTPGEERSQGYTAGEEGRCDHVNPIGSSYRSPPLYMRG